MPSKKRQRSTLIPWKVLKDIPHNSSAPPTDPPDRKKFFQQFFIKIKKKKLGNPLEVVATQHRTIAELKPVGKKMLLSIDHDRQRSNHRTATAFHNKPSY